MKQKWLKLMRHVTSFVYEEQFINQLLSFSKSHKIDEYLKGKVKVISSIASSWNFSCDFTITTLLVVVNSPTLKNWAFYNCRHNAILHGHIFFSATHYYWVYSSFCEGLFFQRIAEAQWIFLTFERLLGIKPMIFWSQGWDTP